MMNQNSKLSVITLSLIAGILLAILLWGAYDIWQKNTKTAALLDEANHAAEVELLSQSVRSFRTSAASDLEAFNAVTLSDTALVGLIEKIESAGKSLGLEINISSVSKVDDKKAGPTDPRLIRIAIETQGPWSKTFSFIRAVENLPHRVMMEEVNLNKSETAWNGNLTFSLYSFN